MQRLLRASPTQGREFEQTLGDSEGPGSLACCSLWCQKKVDLPEQQQSFLLMLIVKSHKNRSKLNPSRTLWGSWARRPMSPISCREQTPACVILPEFQRADLNRCWSGKGWGGKQDQGRNSPETREEQPRNNSTALGPDHASASGDSVNNVFKLCME